MTRRYLENLEAEGGATLEKGTYTVEVIDARATDTASGGSMLWLDLKVLGGPDDGSVASVGVNLPRDGEPGVFYLKNRLRGFTPIIKASGAYALPDEQQGEALAVALVGAKVEADVSIQTDGKYAGSQQLDETRQIVDVAPAMRAAPAPASETVGTTTQTVDVGTQTTIQTNASESLDPPF